MESEKVDERVTDAEFYEGTVRRADAAVQQCSGIVGWNLYSDSGCTWLTSELCSEQPQPGERIRFWGKGFGFIIRGIEIGGRLYRYRTPEEDRAYLSQWGW